MKDGFYREYLASEHWRQRRMAALKAAGFRCSLCGKDGGGIGLDVHHRTYARLGNELPEDLIVVCKPCHKAIHGKPFSTRKRHLTRANAEADKARAYKAQDEQAKASLIEENERLHRLQSRR